MLLLVLRSRRPVYDDNVNAFQEKQSDRLPLVRHFVTCRITRVGERLALSVRRRFHDRGKSQEFRKFLSFFQYSGRHSTQPEYRSGFAIPFLARTFLYSRAVRIAMLTSVVRHFLISREFPTSPRDVFVWQIVGVCICVRSTWILCLGRRSCLWQVSELRGASAYLCCMVRARFRTRVSEARPRKARPSLDLACVEFELSNVGG